MYELTLTESNSTRNFAGEPRIAKFAIKSEEQDMPQTDNKTTPVIEQDAQARIAELEAKLRMAELARDAYDEMINVAEAKFNISIRKKAGAKR